MKPELVEESFSTLARVVRAKPKAVWELGFSGGKDSTLLLHLTVRFLEECGRKPKAVYVVYEDTLLEAWRRPAFEAFRRGVLGRGPLPRRCEDCFKREVRRVRGQPRGVVPELIPFADL